MKRLFLLVVLVTGLNAAPVWNVFDLRPLPTAATHNIPDGVACAAYWQGFTDSLKDAQTVLAGDIPTVVSFTYRAQRSQGYAAMFRDVKGRYYFYGRADAFYAVADAVGENAPVGPSLPTQVKHLAR